jgi:transmembrane sensor
VNFSKKRLSGRIKISEMKAVITKELLFDLFANKVTPLQKKQIDDWLEIRENEELYYKWLEEWENTHPEYQPDSEALLSSYLEFIHSAPPTTAEEPVKDRQNQIRFEKRTLWALAAAVALLIASAGLWLGREAIYFKTYATANGETKTFVLGDGSQVLLNARSSLKVPRWGFSATSREVFLDGEANFSVTHTDDNRKFVVKTLKDFEVVVLGTEFSVFSRQRGAKVVLNKGKVQVNYQQGQTARKLVMKPGEMVSFDQHNQAIRRDVPASETVSMWKEKRFVFDEATLADIAQILEETYGVQVEIGTPALARRSLMGSFRAENLDELLQTISDLLDINVVRQQDTIRLSERNPLP